MDTSVVYFVLDNIRGLVKIGYTANLVRRLRQLRQKKASSGDLTVLMTAGPATQLLESCVHKMFCEFRSHGEWFRAEPAFLNALETLKSRGRISFEGYKLVCPDRVLEVHHAS